MKIVVSARTQVLGVIWWRQVYTESKSISDEKTLDLRPEQLSKSSIQRTRAEGRVMGGRRMIQVKTTAWA